MSTKTHKNQVKCGFTIEKLQTNAFEYNSYISTLNEPKPDHYTNLQRDREHRENDP